MRLLVIRISAMGDVALTVPVLAGMRKDYPEVEIILLTKESFRPFFRGISGVSFFHPDLRNRHKDIRGLIELYRDIRSTGNIDFVIDLHDVLRSKFLRFLFRLSGVKSFIIDKGRSEKRAVIRGIVKRQLPHSVERYSAVFAAASFPVNIPEGPWIIPTRQALGKVEELFSETGVLNIGVAPYAKHALKRWPEEYMVTLLEMISSRYNARFRFFGGADERDRLAELQKLVKNSELIPGDYSLDDELALMSRLDLMIAMDSSNMHMAALTGTKVISIWGGTDPISGFGAWGQPAWHSVFVPLQELSCRPCTVYGKGKCRRGDLACMNWLTPEKVFERIQRVLSS
jgi:ADP-heptose:LPS heptosyltransferase